MIREEWRKIPQFEQVLNYEPIFWINENYEGVEKANRLSSFGKKDIKEASDRLKRFAPYFEAYFPETRDKKGIIESFISPIPNFKAYLEDYYQTTIEGKMYLKRDDQLPIAGTIKARGAIYEVLHHAETLAIEKGLLSGYEDDYRKFGSEQFKKVFNTHTVMVGTTGNLGISVGIMAASLGFHVVIHMSDEAKAWKKKYLRDHGIEVVEHQTNFTEAVTQGRIESENDPKSYFVDDEHSTDLFFGYSVSAERLDEQLKEEGIIVDHDHPLFVYSPCGIGGSPGGTAFGLKQLYGDNVHCFFAQPTHMPSMLVGLMTKQFNQISVMDVNIDAITNMDGLAVPRTSAFVAELMQHYFNGGLTLSEKEEKSHLTHMIDFEGIELEPAALAGTPGPALLFGTEKGREYIKKYHLEDKMKNATHLSWATGGSMVPKKDMQAFYEQGKEENVSF